MTHQTNPRYSINVDRHGVLTGRGLLARVRHLYRCMRTKQPALWPRRRQAWAAITITATLAAAESFLIAVPAHAADCAAAARPSIDWTGCDRRNLMISGSNLQKADLQGANLGLTDLHGSNLTSANLTEAKLMRASLADAKADGANFTKVEGYRTNFSGLSAKGASFQSAELQRADFSGAVLSGSSFKKAELGRANFRGAQFSGNVFAFANLARADFRIAVLAGSLDFSNAYMFLTRLEGVNLSSSKGLSQSQIDLACGDAKTKLPAGLKPSANWPCGTE